MAPPGHTSLLVELPCDQGDPMWAAPDDATIGRVVDCLVGIGWIRPTDVIDAHVARLSHAYPVAALGLDRDLRRIAAWLAPLTNLHLLGRNAEFRYTWIHELVSSGRKVIDEIRRP
jgi:protoporphyrinogen oxidase